MNSAVNKPQYLDVIGEMPEKKFSSPLKLEVMLFFSKNKKSSKKR